jgi:hypothetical protein
MKKIIILALLFSACKSENHNGLYVNHTDGTYAITDDTLEVKDSLIISHSCFQKIRDGKMLPREFKTKQVFELHPVFDDNHLILNNTTYQKIK